GCFFTGPTVADGTLRNRRGGRDYGQPGLLRFQQEPEDTLVRAGVDGRHVCGSFRGGNDAGQNQTERAFFHRLHFDQWFYASRPGPVRWKIPSGPAGRTTRKPEKSCTPCSNRAGKMKSRSFPCSRSAKTRLRRSSTSPPPSVSTSSCSGPPTGTSWCLCSKAMW